MYQRATQDSSLDIKNILIGSENAETKMQKLLEQSNIILSGIYHYLFMIILLLIVPIDVYSCQIIFIVNFKASMCEFATLELNNKYGYIRI